MTIDIEQPDDMENEGSGSRLFVILAVGLAGLIVLGLLAIGGVLVLRNIRGQQDLAQAVPQATPTLSIAAQVPTNTPAPTFTPTMPPNTPTPTATNTPVVLPTDTPSTADMAATATAAAPTDTPVPVGTPVANDRLPDTGFGGMEMALVALGLVGLLFVSRRMRQA